MDSQEDEPMEVDSPPKSQTKPKGSDAKRKLDSPDDDYDAKRQRLNHMAPAELLIPPPPSVAPVAETSNITHPAARRVIKKAKRRHAQVQVPAVPTSGEMNLINIANPSVPIVEEVPRPQIPLEDTPKIPRQRRGRSCGNPPPPCNLPPTPDTQERVRKLAPLDRTSEIPDVRALQNNLANPSVPIVEEVPRPQIPLEDTPKIPRQCRGRSCGNPPPSCNFPPTPDTQEHARKFASVFQASGLRDTRVIQETRETSAAAENDSNCAQVRVMAHSKAPQHKRRNDNINSNGIRQGNSTFSSINTATTKRAREGNNNINSNGNRPEHNAKLFATSSSSSSNENYNQQRRKRQVLPHRRQQQRLSPLRSSASRSPERKN